MELRSWKGFCLCAMGGAFPPDAHKTDELFSPLVFLVDRDPTRSRGWFRIDTVDALFEPENCAVLLPSERRSAPENLRDFVAKNGATVLNTAFSRAFSFLAAEKKRAGLRVTLVGLGDVGGTVLTALKLLGKELAEIRIFDPNEAQCRRYELELNQVLPPDDSPLPRVTICPPEELFDCDLFLFTASRGVPPVGAAVQDVRMAQYRRNAEMLAHYARLARAANFPGLFCQISDPVDQLARVVFLQSNRDGTGRFDAKGLLPEQIQGFGLGVMAARAADCARREGVDFSNGRVFGPHGSGLIVANDPLDYDAALSGHLTEQTVTANLRIRELGFKPYIAPALSSAAVSILRLVRGQVHYGAVPVGGAYFGCRSRMSEKGLCIEREPLHPQLFARIRAAHRALEEFCYD